MFSKKEVRPDLEVFTIFDTKIGAYDIPTFAINEHDLVRQVINMFKDPSQQNNKYLVNAEDYAIFKIASYSKHSGEITPCVLTHIANMNDLRAAAQIQTRPQETSQTPLVHPN